ncbi:biotin transporter BioY [Roseovarius atlanticus]|uniref:biotin transporter BioY n=1 Tax=Roseovarius atlanticus TaxID=1641875 RepID=UPI001C93D83D|nr:biotin transporter BioY [Roseovarius atlanticus]MBY5989076.1 biotin transporter BioY [Roseovarius atlanticus]MBY6124468.1 biotin transporter BioY [Roseovarius atlanticus]MBY6148963.1 biotin transporter BioY [Roseovarius atlanticus]
MADTVLSKAVIGHEGVTKKLGLVIGGSLFIAMAAQVSFGWPVPMSLQTLAILIVGLTFGSQLGLATLVTYLGYGAMGLPVFANGASGAALMGPTAGFLYGFVAMAFLAGLAVEKGLARGVMSTAAVAMAISALLYVPGLAWPALVMGKTMPELWAGWMAPFLLGDAVKAVIAAMVVWGGWKALQARKG